jgi:ParB-like chromosome segregation protein Spo0J
VVTIPSAGDARTLLEPRAPYQVLPPLAPEEYAALKDDIRRRGVLVPVEKDEAGAILDGHQRAHIWEELRGEGVRLPDYPVIVRVGLSEQEKRAHARALNLSRRHLTREQRPQLVADQLRDTPESSNSRVAGTLGVDDKTVAKVRRGLEATSEIPRLARTVGKDGKARPAILARNRAEEARAVKLLTGATAADLPAGISVVKKAEQRAGQRANRERRRHIAAGVTAPHPDIRHGDFRVALSDVAPGSVSLCFTDPPYSEYPLYGAVAEFAARALRPGGSLCVYAPTYSLAEIIPLMKPHLDFAGCIAVRHSGAAAQLNYYRTITRCKFLLWFTRGVYNGGWIVKLIESKPGEKQYHDWAQSSVEASYCVQRMSEPGELVVDPFVGSGTTLLAAKKLGRRCIGAELDPQVAAVASARLAAATT